MKPGPLYTRYPAKAEVLDAPEIRTVVAFVLAMDAGRVPSQETLEAACQIFQRILCCEAPGTVPGKWKGRPSDNGLSSDIVVSAFIEIEIRQLPQPKNGLARACMSAINEFGIGGERHDAQRQVRRHWKAGKNTVQHLDTADLEKIFVPAWGVVPRILDVEPLETPDI